MGLSGNSLNASCVQGKRTRKNSSIARATWSVSHCGWDTYRARSSTVRSDSKCIRLRGFTVI